MDSDKSFSYTQFTRKCVNTLITFKMIYAIFSEYYESTTLGFNEKPQKSNSALLCKKRA